MYVYLSEGYIFFLLRFLIENKGKVNSTKKKMSSMESRCADIQRLYCENCLKLLIQERNPEFAQGNYKCVRCDQLMSPNSFRKKNSSYLGNYALQHTNAIQKYPCPFARLAKSQCKLTGTLLDIGNHIKITHNAECIESNGWISLPLNLKRYQRAIFTSDNLFFLLFSANSKMLKVIVFHVGPKEYSSGYKCIFVFKNGGQERKITNACHHYLKGVVEVLRPRDYVIVQNDFESFDFKIDETNQGEPMDVDTTY